MHNSYHRQRAEDLAMAASKNLNNFIDKAMTPQGANNIQVELAQAQATLAQVHATLSLQ